MGQPTFDLLAPLCCRLGRNVPAPAVAHPFSKAHAVAGAVVEASMPC